MNNAIYKANKVKMANAIYEANMAIAKAQLIIFILATRQSKLAVV